MAKFGDSGEMALASTRRFAAEGNIKITLLMLTKR